MSEQDLTKQQAARLLGVSERTINRYVAEGKLDVRYEPITPYIARMVISLESVKRFMPEARNLNKSLTSA